MTRHDDESTTPRRLTDDEIRILCNRKGALPSVVDGFFRMNGLDNAPSLQVFDNLIMLTRSEARTYKWSAATVRAVRDGLLAMYGKRGEIRF